MNSTSPVIVSNMEPGMVSLASATPAQGCVLKSKNHPKPTNSAEKT